MKIKLINLLGATISELVDYIGFKKFVAAVIVIGLAIAIFAPIIVRLI